MREGLGWDGKGVPPETLTDAEQAIMLPRRCGCAYQYDFLTDTWHLVTRERCPLHKPREA